MATAAVGHRTCLSNEGMPKLAAGTHRGQRNHGKGHNVNRSRPIGCALILAAAVAGSAPQVRAEPTEDELAKLVQNPVGNLISVPFQNNANLNFGPEKGTLDVLNIQPVIPFSLNNDWNIITRTIIPVVSLPPLAPRDSRTNGIGDVQFNAFLSPAQPGQWIWGVGAIVQVPTHSNARLGNDNWGLGPTVVMLHMARGDPWVYGVLVNNIWSAGTHGGSPSYSNGLIQPFLNYNFAGGAYLTTSPIITVDWKASGGNHWTVPLGGGVGKVLHLGMQPVNMQIAAYYNVVRPDFSANWQIRAQAQFLFPK
jgi:hypothetical protein